jgi:tetratricopeptide (TPR) repeat protein
MNHRFAPFKCGIIGSMAIVSLLVIGFTGPISFGSHPAFAAPTNEPDPPKKPVSKSKKKKKTKKKTTPQTKFNFGSGNSSLWDTDDANSIADLAPARAMIELEDFRGATRQLELLNRPDDANVLNMLGFSHRKLGLIDVGIAFYLRALENNPRHKGVHEYLGEAYLQKDDVGKARVLLGKLALICGTSCKEYKELADAVREFERRHTL